MGQEKSKLAFSKTDVELIKNSTGFDEDTIKEWYSDCPDGQLTPEAFMKIYSKCFSTGNPKEFCDHLIGIISFCHYSFTPARKCVNFFKQGIAFKTCQSRSRHF